MSEQAQAIFDEAMKLSVAERERLVSQLMCSIDDVELSLSLIHISEPTRPY